MLILFVLSKSICHLPFFHFEFFTLSFQKIAVVITDGKTDPTVYKKDPTYAPAWSAAYTQQG